MDEKSTEMVSVDVKALLASRMKELEQVRLQIAQLTHQKDSLGTRGIELQGIVKELQAILKTATPSGAGVPPVN